MIDVRRITAENAGDLKLKNDPFVMPGRMIPRLEEGKWSYRIERFDHPEDMTFPEENYDLEALDQEGAIALGAYIDGVCVGLAVLKPGFLKYMYVYDLKVSADYRRKGIGQALIQEALQQARQLGYIGLYLQAQDNNVNACLFYLRTGFVIGGFDNRVYTGTSQEGKADILFYTAQEAAL